MNCFYFILFVVAVSAKTHVTTTEAPEECGENATWNECANPCKQRSCNDSKPPVKPTFCPTVCVEQCTCNSGYVKGPGGKCILEKDCPPKNNCTGQNEVWTECGSGCEAQCIEPEDPIGCAAVCVQKCSCKPGHVRGPDRKCIAKKDCPPKKCSDPNAVWSECASACNQHSCGESDEPKSCTAVCLRQCTCKPGYVTGPGGKCILKKDCPPKKNCSDPNAVWNECGSNCEAQCIEPSDPKVCPAVCVQKCSCKPGYVIGPDGKCVLKKDCPPKNNCSDPNAVWNECGSGCEAQCIEPSDPRVCPAVCLHKCSCKPGYVIGPDGKCVLKKDCPPKNNCSDPNAVWNECGSGCEAQCIEPSDPRVCPAVCLHKCSCKPGYVIGPDGKCVLKKDCPPKNNCSDPNAVWNECGSGCEAQCIEPSEPRVCPAVCLHKCSCKPGYVIGPDGKCVLKKDCPPKNNCSDPNAVWNECGSGCEAQCIEPSEPRVCPAVCLHKCSCKPGYVIGPDGKCVLKKDCPPKKNCSDPNAVWNECGSGCEAQCIEPSEPRVCPAVCLHKCSCKPGYVIGPDGKCVLKKDCPPKNNCSDPNAVWNECGSGCEAQCIEPSEPRVCPAVCLHKCSCKPGYVIGPDGKCVLKKDCPPKNNCSDPNAVWNECGSYCEALCIEPSDPRVCPASCVQKCSCKPGYVIGPDGKCVLEKNCPPKNNCTGPNEIWNECGSYCEAQCIEPSDPIVCPAVCVSKCTCKPGHVRGPGGKCTAKKDCPPKKNCSDPNAVWNTCARPCAQPSCDKPAEPEQCASLLCLQQCTCKPGYVTGPGGKCILKKDCPKKCPGRNQFWNKCGSGCEPRCDKSHEGQVCPAVCVEKCSCKPGYVIADNGDCVKEEDCDTTCE